MADISTSSHRARMVLGVKMVCSQCQGKSSVDSCDKECPLSFWISNLHRQKLYDLSLLSADICRYCHSKCGHTYPVCQNHSQVAAQCLMFIAKESAVTVPGSKSGLNIPAIPVAPVWKDSEPCQK